MINKITLIGRLGQDPETRTLEGGATVCRLSVATSEAWKKQGDTEWQEETQWHNVIAWRELAERISQKLKKGHLVYVEGKVTYRKYTDSQGMERTATDIVASTVRSLERADNSDRAAAQFPAEPPASVLAREQSLTAPAAPADPTRAQAVDPLPF